MDLRSRVLFRYRAGGVLEPPPQMLSAMSTWLRTVYAGAVYKHASELWDKFFEAPELSSQDWEEAKNWETWGTLPKRMGLPAPEIDRRVLRQTWKLSTQSISFRLVFKNLDSLSPAVVAGDEGDLEALTWGIDTPVTEALPVGWQNGILDHEYKVTRVRGEHLAWDVKIWWRPRKGQAPTDLVQIIKEAKKISGGLPREFTQMKGSRVDMKFPLNLTGWPHRNLVGGPLPRVLPLEVLLKLFDGDLISNVSGGYSPLEEDFHIRILIMASQVPKSLRAFRAVLEELDSAVSHELQHAAQDLVKTFSGVGFGLPPKEVRDRGVSQVVRNELGKWSRNPDPDSYALDDIEFQTWVTTATDVLSEQFRHVPHRHWKQLIAHFLGGSPISSELDVLVASSYSARAQGPVSWFVQLKSANRKKWEAAVKYVWKNLAKEGYRI